MLMYWRLPCVEFAFPHFANKLLNQLGGLTKGVSIQLQKMLQLDAKNLWGNVCWDIKGLGDNSTDNYNL